MKIQSKLKSLAKALAPLPERGFRAALAAARLLLAAALSLLMAGLCPANAGEPCHWKRKPNEPAPFQFDTFHGETIDFQCTFVGFSSLPFAGSGDSSPRLYYQTNGMAAAWWDIPATVSTTVVTNCHPPITNYSLSAVFPPAADPGAERITVFFGAPSNAYASAQVRFRNSPGSFPNTLAPPSVLDWQAELAAATNDLFKSFAPTITNTYTKSETDARIAELAPRTSLAPATNYTDRLQSDLVAGEIMVGRADEANIANYSKDANYSSRAAGLDGDSGYRTSDEIFTQLDSAATREGVTNIVTNIVTKAYVESLGIESGISAETATNIAEDVGANLPYLSEEGGSVYGPVNIDSDLSSISVTADYLDVISDTYLNDTYISGVLSLNDETVATEAYADTASAAAVANADTTYRRTIGITNINQSVQYVNITDAAPTTLAISIPTDGMTKDWMVYVVSVTNVTLSLPAATWWMADGAYTNDVPPATPTAFWFSQIADGIFIIGRQELTEVTLP